jgi:HlyD family secretion protein
MGGITSGAVLRDIETLFDAGTAVGISDRQLLERFASRRDVAREAAFEALVRRHGPMVLRVCHNLLHDPNDAHDAFQATFLVLVRRSGSIRKRDSVGGWLYGVACRVAARARVDAARRRSGERRAALRVVEAVDPPDVDEAAGMGFGPIVQEEVRRLPEKYRAVVVLCYWQGLTHEQAAVQLGCPLGTVRSRQARARDILRRRLIARGLVPLAGVVAAGLDRTPAIASGIARPLAPVPPELLRSTIQAAVAGAGAKASAQMVSGFATSLAQSVLWSSTMFNIKMAIVGVVVAGLVGSGGWFAALKGPLAQAQPKANQKAAAGKKKRNFRDANPVYSRVKDLTTVIMLIPDGSRVKKGDIVGELDSASLKDQLVNQKIMSKNAEATYENSKLVREVAELAVVEYEEAIYQNELMEVTGDIKIAEEELAVAEESLKHAVANRKVTSLVEVNIPKLAVHRAQFNLEKAQSRRKLLVNYTKTRKLKALKSDVEKTRAEELVQRANWALSDSKAKSLERQIAGCTIVAPRDGTLVYAEKIEEGATVRERQMLFEIVPTPEADIEKQ